MARIKMTRSTRIILLILRFYIGALLLLIVIKFIRSVP